MEPRLIAAGRSSEILDLGDGRLLRRFRSGGDPDLDLHPASVILSPHGPVVIDWANARRGEPLLDVAHTWVICATSSGVGRLGERTRIRELAAHRAGR